MKSNALQKPLSGLALKIPSGADTNTSNTILKYKPHSRERQAATHVVRHFIKRHLLHLAKLKNKKGGQCLIPFFLPAVPVSNVL